MMKKLAVILFVIVLYVDAVQASAELQIYDVVAEDNVVVLPVSYDYMGNDISVIVYDGIVDGNSWMSNMPKPAYIGLLSVGDDNKCTPEFVLTSPGTYTAIIGDGVSDETSNVCFTYVNKSDNDRVVADITNCIQYDKGSEELLRIIDNGIDGLSTNKECYSANDKEAASMIYEELKNAEEINNTAVSACFGKAYLLSGLKSGTITDVDKYIQSTGIRESVYRRYYDNAGNGRGILIGKILKKTDSVEEYNEKLGEAICLSAVAYSGDTALIKEILNKYNTMISSSDITDEVIRKVNGKEFMSFDALNTFIEELIHDSDGNADGGGSSGSGGGGFSSNNNSSADRYLSGREFESVQNDSTADSENVFYDIEAVPWAKDAIEGLFYKGIILGKEEGKFAPDDFVLREEFVKMLVLGFELNTVGSGMAFEDVDASQWYYTYVKCAYYSDIIKGESSEMFGTGKNISRQDLAVMAYNTCLVCDVLLPKNRAETDIFSDENSISDYAKTAVEALKNAGVLNGYDGEFNPHGSTTRAEAAKVIYCLMQYIKQPNAN